MAENIRTLFNRLINESYVLSNKVTEMKTAVINAEALIGVNAEESQIKPAESTTTRPTPTRRPTPMIEVPSKPTIGGPVILPATQKNETREEIDLFRKPVEPIKLAAEPPPKKKTDANKELEKIEESLPPLSVSKIETEPKLPPSKPNILSPPGQTSTASPLQSLLALIREKKEMTLDEAAKTLNTSPALVESWAKILDSNNLIKLQFPLIGKPVMKAI